MTLHGEKWDTRPIPNKPSFLNIPCYALVHNPGGVNSLLILNGLSCHGPFWDHLTGWPQKDSQGESGQPPHSQPPHWPAGRTKLEKFQPEGMKEEAGIPGKHH